MKRVNLSDLKAKLSAHIRRVREGEEVLVCDRNTPVARIIPCQLEDYSEPEKSLIASGALIPPRRRRRASSPDWPQPPGNIPDEAVERLWREERGEG